MGVKSNMSYDELVERERIWDQGFNEGMYYATKLLNRPDATEPENPFRAERHRKERNRA
jgi:hypothetical protein